MNDKPCTVHFHNGLEVQYDYYDIRPSGWIYCRKKTDGERVQEVFPPHRIEAVEKDERTTES